MTVAGTSGYQDWRRVVDWDSPVIIEKSVAELEKLSAFSTPVFNTARFAYLAGLVKTQAAQPHSMTVKWFADQAGTLPLGERIFPLSASIAAAGQVRFANLGPWCQVTLTGKGVEPLFASLRFFLTNRVQPIDFTPSKNVLVSRVEKIAVVGKSLAPFAYFAGPVKVFAETLAAATAIIQLRALVLAETQQVLDQFTVPAGPGGFATAEFFAPAGAWEINMIPSAETEIRIAVTPSWTGG